MIKTTFLFSFNSLPEANLVYNALFPESQQHISKTSVQLKVQDNKLSLIIFSADVSALRAACNSYLRWIQTALSVNGIV